MSNFPESNASLIRDLLSSAAGKGAALVGVEGGGTLQDAIDRDWCISLASPLFGAKSNDPTFDNKAAVEAWLSFAEASGKTAYCPKGAWYVSEVRFNVSANLSVFGAPGAVLCGHSGYETPVIIIDGGARRPALNWDRLDVDNSLRTFSLAEQSGEGLTLKYLNGSRITRSTFGNFDKSYLDAAGDTGLVLNQCSNTIVDGNRFYGQPDKGIYSTGGPSASESDDRGDLTVINNYFYRCEMAAMETRQGRRFTFSNNRVIQCRIGVGRLWASDVQPAREMIAIGNYFEKIGGRAFWLLGEGHDNIAFNDIEDWGYQFDGATQDVAYAVLCQGVQNSKFVGNTFRMRNWASRSNYRVIDFQQFNFGEVTGRNCQNNILRDNIFENIPNGRGILETTSQAYDNVSDNVFINVLTPVQGGNSRTRHTIRLGDGSSYEQRNNVRFDGAFSPTIEISGATGVSVAYASQLGRYTRQGNLVTVSGSVQGVVTFSGGGQVRVGGLPFTSVSGGGNFHGVLAFQTGITFPVGATFAASTIVPNASYIRFQLIGPSGKILEASEITSGATLRLDFEITYQCA